jgi:hypothetical protein
VIQETSDRYIEAHELLTGDTFTDYLNEMGAS